MTAYRLVVTGQDEIVVTEEDVKARIGHRFAGGLATIEPYADWLLRDVVGSPPARDDLAHPLAAFLLATHGLGVDLGALFALFGTSAADGPLLGEWTVDVIEPLRVGQAYLVSGEVVGAVRKSGLRAGVFDVVTLAVTIADGDGRPHAIVRPAYVFPRRQR
jgi:hypothetical protein